MDPTTEFILAKMRERKPTVGSASEEQRERIGGDGNNNDASKSVASPVRKGVLTSGVDTRPRQHVSKLLCKWEKASRDGTTIDPNESLCEPDALICAAVKMAKPCVAIHPKTPLSRRNPPNQSNLEKISAPARERPVEKFSGGITARPVEKFNTRMPEQPVDKIISEMHVRPVEKVSTEMADRPVQNIGTGTPDPLVEKVDIEIPACPVVSTEKPESTITACTPNKVIRNDDNTPFPDSSSLINDGDESENSSALSDYLNDAIACGQATMKTPPKPSDIFISVATPLAGPTTPSPRYPGWDRTDGIYPRLDCDYSPLPLMHTVSIYRKLEKSNQKNERPESIIFKPPVSPSRDPPADAGQRRKYHDGEKLKQWTSSGLMTSAEYDGRVKSIQHLIIVQQEQILQASRALSYCKSSAEFRGPRQEADAEAHKALLVATERRRCLNEERKRLDDCYHNRKSYCPPPPLGTLTISSITVPLRRNFFDSYEGDDIYYFFCILKYRDTLHVTKMVNSDEIIPLGELTFSSEKYIQFHSLPHDFEISLDVYVWKTLRDQLSQKDKTRSTGRKLATLTKNRSPFNMFGYGSNSSLGGPAAVMDTSFQLAGHLVITMASVKRRKFSLQQVDIDFPLEGGIFLDLHCLPESIETDTASGFLHRLEEIAGRAAWERMWCIFDGSALKFWKYPEDELENKPPVYAIDMKCCVSDQVGPASKMMTTRPHAFAFETSDGISTVLSADTKEEFSDWCGKLNKLLSNIRMWPMDGQYNTRRQASTVPFGIYPL